MDKGETLLDDDCKISEGMMCILSTKLSIIFSDVFLSIDEAQHSDLTTVATTVMMILTACDLIK